jgi:probable rRNA maturation factor
MEPGSNSPADAGFPSSLLEGPQAGPASPGAAQRVATQPTVLVLDPKWRAIIPQAERIAARAAAAAGVAGTVVLTSDREVKALNGRHRKKNKPTNVLTFEFGGAPQGQGCGQGNGQGYLGGDIILALGTVRREANSARKPPAHHLAHLVVHGALHLRGYDHLDAGAARRMEMAEARILARLRVPNPWKRR